VPGRVPGRGDGAAAAGVPAPVPRRVHRSVAGGALLVPDLPDTPGAGSGRRPSAAGLSALVFFGRAPCFASVVRYFFCYGEKKNTSPVPEIVRSTI